MPKLPVSAGVLTGPASGGVVKERASAALRVVTTPDAEPGAQFTLFGLVPIAIVSPVLVMLHVASIVSRCNVPPAEVASTVQRRSTEVAAGSSGLFGEMLVKLQKEAIELRIAQDAIIHGETPYD